MAKTIKAALAALAGAALLAGCATGPYYDDYGYNNGYGYGNSYGYYDGYGYNNGYGYGYGPTYYEPGYIAPSVGFGVTYIDRDDNHRHYRGDRDGRREWRNEDRREWRGDNRRDEAIVRQQEREARQMDRNDAERNARLGAGG